MEHLPKRVFDFLPLSVRLETLGGVATPLVLRGTPLPTKRSDQFSTAADEQTSVEIKLLLGESSLACNDLQLGTFRLEQIPPSRRGTAQITIEFSVDATCAVTARASVQGSQLSAEKTFESPEELSDIFIAKLLGGAESSRAADEANIRQIEATNRAKGLIAQAEESLRQGSNAHLSEAVAALGLALSSNDNNNIREKSDALELLLPKFSLFGSGFDFGDFFQTPRASRPAARRSSAVGGTAPREQRLASAPPPQILGKIFGGASFTLDTQLCFVLMPFEAKFQPLYDDHIKPAVQRAGLRCERADEIHGPTLITWDIWERINRARCLIAELTDQNSNVFYELGLAHALSKDVILITQSMDFVPFDLKTIRCVCYDFTPRGAQKLEQSLVAAIDALMKSTKGG